MKIVQAPALKAPIPALDVYIGEVCQRASGPIEDFFIRISKDIFYNLTHNSNATLHDKERVYVYDATLTLTRK